MELLFSQAAIAFAAIGSSQRLAIIRTLVRAGATGQPVGRIQQVTGIPASTLSHHIRSLMDAGLITRRREGRKLYTAANFEALEALAGFILAECCIEAMEAHEHDIEPKLQIGEVPA